MKKLIAIVITFIFIFDGAGYCLRAPIMSNNSERKELIDSVYICRAIAIAIRDNLVSNLARNIHVNSGNALDIGGNTDFSPAQLLKDKFSVEDYGVIMEKISEKSIKVDIDSEGYIWVFSEPENIYMRVETINIKTRNYSYMTKQAFQDAFRKIKIARESASAREFIASPWYPDKVAVYDRYGNEVALKKEDLLDRRNRETYFIIHKPENNIGLVSFEYEGMLERFNTEEIRNLFERVNKMNLKIAITARGEKALRWMDSLITSYPQLNSCIHFFHIDNNGVDVMLVSNEAHMQPNQLMHFTSTRASLMHRAGFISAMIVPQGKIPVSVIMNSQIDAVIIGGRRVNNIIEVIQRWTKVPEKRIQAKPVSISYDAEEILKRNPEFEDDARVKGLLERMQSDSNDLIARNMLGSECIRRGKPRETLGICLDLLEIIASRLVAPNGHSKEFLDKNKEIAMRTICSAYHGIGDYASAAKTAKRLLSEFPEKPVNIRIFMYSCIWTGDYNEGILTGESAVRKYEKDEESAAEFKRSLVTLYLDRALKSSMLGEPNEADCKKALELIGVNEIPSKKAEHLGIVKNGKKTPYYVKNGDISIRNEYNGEEYAITERSLNHILSEHTGEIREFGLNRTLFPAEVDSETVKELIIKTARYGTNISKSFPWGIGDIMVWYVADNDPVLAAKTGITRMEIVISNGVILTGYPNMGEKIRYVNKYGDVIDKSIVIIHESLSNFIWNKNSKRRAFLLAGDGNTDLSVALNNPLFGSMKLALRELVISHALWEGESLGHEALVSNGIPQGLAEVYKYEITEEYAERYNISHKTIYLYLDVASRRLLKISAQEPNIIHVTNNAETDVDSQVVPKYIKTYSLARLQTKHKIGGKLPSIEELQERWEYFYDEETKVFYRSKAEYEIAKKHRKKAIKQQSVNDSAGVSAIQTIEEPEESAPGENHAALELVEPVSVPEVTLKAQKPDAPKISVTLNLTSRQKADFRKLASIRFLIKKGVNINSDEIELLANAALNDVDKNIIRANIRSLKKVEDKLLNRVIGELKKSMAEIAGSKKAGLPLEKENITGEAETLSGNAGLVNGLAERTSNLDSSL